MQAIELPSQYKVTTQKSSDTICCGGFIFINFRCGRPLNPSLDPTSGVFLVEVILPKTNLLICVYREGPYILTLNIYNLLSYKLTRRGTIYANTNAVNSRYILRPNHDSKKLIFYLECQSSIEIRSILSLKLIKTLSLAQICNQLNMSNKFSELKCSVDMDYISHLSSIIMLLNTKIVLIQVDKATTTIPMVLFDNEIEKFNSLRYNSKQRTLLVEGTSSILLLKFDEVGVNSTRLLTSNKLGKASKLLCWNPFEDLVVVSQRIAQKREHYHILSYRTENLSVAASILGVPAYGTFYEEESQSFLYIEGTEEQQAISRVSLKDFNSNIGSFEKPLVLEGECMTYIPVTDHQHDSYYMIGYRTFLYVGPNFNNDKVFIR